MYISVRRPQPLVILGRRPEIIEQSQLGFVGRRVCPRAESAPNFVTPTFRFSWIHHQVVAFKVEETVTLDRPAPNTLQPACTSCRPITQLCFLSLGSNIVFAHLLSADAPNFEVSAQLRVHHDVDIADLLVATHLTSRVIGIVCRFIIGPQVDDAHTRPSLVRYASHIPSVSIHRCVPSWRRKNIRLVLYFHLHQLTTSIAPQRNEILPSKGNKFR